MTSLKSYFYRLRHGPPFVAGEEMQYEALRLASFATWPETAEKRPAQLASNGFYYCGHDDLVQCFSCGGKISNWSVRDDVQAEHKKRFPRCQFLQDTGSSDADEAYGSDILDEVDSVLKHMISDPIKGRSGGSVGVAGAEESTKMAEAEITRSSECVPNCHDSKPSVLSPDRKEVDNAVMNGVDYQHRSLNEKYPQSFCIPDWKLDGTSAPKQHEDINGQPRFPQYATELERLETFTHWPKGSVIKPLKLIKAGFFYVGYADDVKCFFCGHTIRHWNCSHDPWILHTQLNPECGFLRNNKGDGCVSEASNNYFTSLALSGNKSISNHVWDLNDLDNITSVKQMEPTVSKVHLSRRQARNRKKKNKKTAQSSS